MNYHLYAALLAAVSCMPLVAVDNLPAPFGSGDWPCWQGPLSCGATVDVGLKLIDEMKPVREVWVNAEQLPTLGWTNRKQKGISGGYSSPVVSHGRVYHYHYVPSGPVDENYVKQYGDEFPGKFRVLADEVILCVDARTGKTLWKQVFKEEGYNINHSAQGPLALPFVTDKRVYALSIGGWLRCLDATTGEQLWRTALGPGGVQIQSLRQKAVETKTMVVRGQQASLFGHCPTISDGVVVCSDNWDPDEDCAGLVGVDADSGRLLWGPIADAAEFCASPLRTVVDGKPYVLSMSTKRFIMVEPKTGRIVWEVNDHKKVRQTGTMAVAEGHVVFHSREGRGQEAGDHGQLRCYRFDAMGATLAWELPSGRPQGKQSYAWGSCLIYGGLAWGCFNSEEFPSGAYGGVDLKTGKPVVNLYANLCELIASEGRIFDGASMVARWDGKLWIRTERGRSPVKIVGHTRPTVAGGQMFTWGGDGHLRCYDLRK